MSDMKHYFIVENDQQAGPFTVEELKSKRIKKSTVVWTEGMTDWVTADNVDELKDFLISDPPPPPRNSTPPPYNTPQQPLNFDFKTFFEKESNGLLVGTIGVILFSLFNWVKISFFGLHLKFNLFTLSGELNGIREIFDGSDEITLIRIVVVILVIALILSFALLIISLIKPQLKSKSALAYCGFGLCSIVTGIFIVAMMFISSNIEHWILTVSPFITLGIAIVSMIKFVKRPEKIDFSSIASEIREMTKS